MTTRYLKKLRRISSYSPRINPVYFSKIYALITKNIKFCLNMREIFYICMWTFFYKKNFFSSASNQRISDGRAWVVFWGSRAFTYQISNPSRPGRFYQFTIIGKSMGKSLTSRFLRNSSRVYFFRLLVSELLIDFPRLRA